MEKGKFMEFNERLRYLIDCEEIKIKDLAPKLCLSASTLSNYAQGIREPDYDTLRRIADYFGVSIDYLLGHKSPVTDDERQLLALFRSFTPSQRPVLVMPTGNTSYCSAQGLWPRARSQAEADTQLTSCSLETPPKKSATRSLELLFIKKTPFVKLRGPLGHTTSLQLIIITYYACVG